MIEHHHFDAFMPASFHGSAPDRLFRFLGGVAAPTFLFLAGLAMVLMMEGRLAKGESRRAAMGTAFKRGLWIFLGAYAFRFQEWALAFGASPASSMLRIDVLNCIGVALMLTALLWGLGLGLRARAVWFFLAAVLTVGFAPPIWHADLSGWPPVLASYVNGRSPAALFPLFPWMGFCFVGGLAGLLLVRARRAADPDRAEVVAILGLVTFAGFLWVGTRAVDGLPFQLYAKTEWWLDSPAYFLLRCCSEVWLLAGCWMVEKLARPLWARLPAGPLLKLGQHSLLVYWVHIEIVYGRFTWRLRGQLSFAQAAFALALLLLAMVALSYAADPISRRLAAWLARGRQRLGRKGAPRKLSPG